MSKDEDIQILRCVIADLQEELFGRDVAFDSSSCSTAVQLDSHGEFCTLPGCETPTISPTIGPPIDDMSCADWFGDSPDVFVDDGAARVIREYVGRPDHAELLVVSLPMSRTWSDGCRQIVGNTCSQEKLAKGDERAITPEPAYPRGRSSSEKCCSPL